MSDHSVDLVERILDALIQSDFPGHPARYFAPERTLEAITTSSVAETIFADPILPGNLNDSDRKLVDFIRQDAREIFAICICAGFQNLKDIMRLFMKHRISDAELPIPANTIEGIWPKPRQAMQRLHFENSQCVFRAQRFPMEKRFSVIHLPQNTVLPILKVSAIQSEGQFGVVHKVTIHEEYLDLRDPIRQVRQNEYNWSQSTSPFCSGWSLPNMCFRACPLNGASHN